MNETFSIHVQKVDNGWIISSDSYNDNDDEGKHTHKVFEDQGDASSHAGTLLGCSVVWASS